MAMVDVVALHSYLFFMSGARYIPTIKLGILEKAHCRLCNMLDIVSVVSPKSMLHPQYIIIIVAMAFISL